MPTQNARARARIRARSRAGTGPSRFATAGTVSLKVANYIVYLMVSVAAVVVAVQANNIADMQTKNTAMQATIMQAQTGPNLSFETTPGVLTFIAGSDDSTSALGAMHGTRTILVHNSGAPVDGLLCDPITVLEISYAGDDEQEEWSSAIVPLEGLYLDPVSEEVVRRGTGELAPIEGTPDNIGVAYALLDGVNKLISARGLTDGEDYHVAWLTFVRAEFNNVLGERENRLYACSQFRMYRVDPTVAADLMFALQDRAVHDQVLYVEDDESNDDDGGDPLPLATPEAILSVADDVMDRVGSDAPAATYEPLLRTAYYEPEADMRPWLVTFFQEPMWDVLDPPEVFEFTRYPDIPWCDDCANE